MILAVVGKICSILFFFGAWWCYIPPKSGDTQPSATDQQVVVLNNGVTTPNGAQNGSATPTISSNPENRY